MSWKMAIFPRSSMAQEFSETKQPDVWAVEFITFPVATGFLLLRLLSRRLTKISLWWDDYFALCAYTMALFWVVIIPFWIGKGLGLHIDEVPGVALVDALYYSRLMLYIAELVYASSLFFGKMSILCFYWRMFRVSNIKLPIQILITCSIIWMIIRTFMAIFHCVPVNKFWDATVTGGRCDIDDSKFFFGTIFVHVVIDIAILILPIWQIRKLQLPRLQKAGIMVMFMFGIFICVAAIIIIITSQSFDNASTDLTWNLRDIIIWATVEVNLVTVSACMPTIRPAFLYLFMCTVPSSQLGSGSGSHPHSYGLSQTKKSIRLSTLAKTAGDDDMDDGSSSTHQLADTERAVSESDFESHAMDRFRGNHTTVTGLGDRSSDEFHPTSEEMGGGIMVKNETVVRVSKQ